VLLAPLSGIPVTLLKKTKQLRDFFNGRNCSRRRRRRRKRRRGPHHLVRSAAFSRLRPTDLVCVKQMKQRPKLAFPFGSIAHLESRPWTAFRAQISATYGGRRVVRREFCYGSFHNALSPHFRVPVRGLSKFSTRSRSGGGRGPRTFVHRCKLGSFPLVREDEVLERVTQENREERNLKVLFRRFPLKILTDFLNCSVQPKPSKKLRSEASRKSKRDRIQWRRTIRTRSVLDPRRKRPNDIEKKRQTSIRFAFLHTRPNARRTFRRRAKNRQGCFYPHRAFLNDPPNGACSAGRAEQDQRLRQLRNRPLLGVAEKEEQ